jgi:hypothetical protein
MCQFSRLYPEVILILNNNKTLPWIVPHWTNYEMNKPLNVAIRISNKCSDLFEFSGSRDGFKVRIKERMRQSSIVILLLVPSGRILSSDLIIWWYDFFFKIVCQACKFHRVVLIRSFNSFSLLIYLFIYLFIYWASTEINSNWFWF